jgi:hypothetical protein
VSGHDLPLPGRAPLPQPLSGHLSWQYWRPAKLPQRYAVIVGWSRQGLGSACDAWYPTEPITNRYNIPNEESHTFVAVCHLRAPLGELWNRGIASDHL